ncbi:hypothetical protein GCM10020220_073820 [Nonomuraea rubra]
MIPKNSAPNELTPLSMAVHRPVSTPARRLPVVAASAAITSASMENCMSCSPAYPTPTSRIIACAHSGPNSGVAMAAVVPPPNSTTARIIAPRLSKRLATRTHSGIVSRIGPTSTAKSVCVAAAEPSVYVAKYGAAASIMLTASICTQASTVSHRNAELPLIAANCSRHPPRSGSGAPVMGARAVPKNEPSMESSRMPAIVIAITR